MNFGKFDVTVLITMSLAIICMSFVFPALGMTEADADENDIPDFDIESDRFDIVGDFPDSPGTPTEGTLTWHEDTPGLGTNNVFLEGDYDQGVNLAIINEGTSQDPQMDVALYNVTSNEFDDVDNATMNTSGDTRILEGLDYQMEVELDQVRDQGESDFEADVGYQLYEQDPDDASWIQRIPIVGGAVDAADSIAAVLSWFASIVYWFFGTMFEILLNLVNVLYETVSFQFGLVAWLTTTYTGVISSASSWASIFVAIPGILLSIELGKITLVAISLLPTT